ncbi:FKBP-type peptidyl-prolyl cis-trans isomerase [Marisediminicola sp. LYQ134]|uniref:FKBP-type peptidyl-prolyl cis-trans isomerase n=1 Tax=Marisediminicola sp. LYQ134 TaxID=3391061 RepID=UPI003983976E
MPKKIFSTVLIAGVVLTLAACSPSESETAEAGCTPTASGASSDQVEVSGTVGEEPAVEFPTPLTSSTTERTVVTDGEGEQALEGSTVTVNYTAYNATNGDEIDGTEYTEETAAEFTIDEARFLPGLVRALECSVPGDRIAAVIPPADAFAETGNDAFEIGATDSMVFVLDVVSVEEAPEPVEVLPRADGEDQSLPDGFPEVELDEDGAPSITVPDEDAPAELEIATLKQGDGTEVADGDLVTVHYTGFLWETGEVFDSSWERGEPAAFPTNQVIEGFSAALVGAQVGSQVIAVIPPEQGYGDNVPPDSPITPESTLIFVVDILATEAQ